MVFLTVVQSELEEKFQFDKIMANKDGVISLPNAGYMDIISAIKVDSKVSILGNRQFSLLRIL